MTVASNHAAVGGVLHAWPLLGSLLWFGIFDSPDVFICRAAELSEEEACELVPGTYLLKQNIILVSPAVRTVN